MAPSCRVKLDAFTKKHLTAWLQNTFRPGDARRVRRGILCIVKEDRRVLDTRSWPEIERMAKSSGYLDGARRRR